MSTRSSWNSPRFLVLATLIATLAPGLAPAQDYAELLRHVPDDANVLILANIEEIMKSPIAAREGWAKTKGAAIEAGLVFPPETRQMIQASRVDWTDGVRPVWDVSLLAVEHPVSAAEVAKREKGYVDKVQGHEAAWSPRNAFFVALSPRIGAMVFPANRQQLSQWLGAQDARKAPTVSPYLKHQVAEAFGKPRLVVACDMTSLLSPPQVEARVKSSAALAGKVFDVDQVTKILSGLEGITFAVDAGEALEAHVRVDFHEPTAPLAAFAKPLIFEVLEGQGAMLPDFRDWKVEVAGNAVLLRGKITSASLKVITSLVAIPSSNGLPAGKPIETAAAGGTPPPPPAPTPETPVEPSASPGGTGVENTKRYFHDVSGLLDDLRDKSKSGLNYHFQLWFDRYALKIDRMPILGVDPEALNYGSFVSETLRGMRNTKFDSNANQVIARATSAYNGFYGVDRGVATQIKREGNATSAMSVNSLWTALETKTAETRKALTEKYQVEF